MKTRIACVIFAITLGCAPSNPARAPQVKSMPAPQAKAALAPPYYLATDSIEVKSALIAPPAQDSSETHNEIDEIVMYQKSSSYASDCKRANEEAGETLNDFFGPANGPLTVTEVQKWDPLFKNLALDAEYFETKAKEAYKRPRPLSEDARVTPCLVTPKSSSYPSGHATRSKLFADILGELDPARREIFEKRAYEIGTDRVIGGVHHTSDIVAGQQLGDEVYNALMKNDHFIRDFTLIK